MLSYITTNWKTSLAGILIIALAGLKLVGISVPGAMDLPTALTVGLGMLVAKDGNVSGSG